VVVGRDLARRYGGARAQLNLYVSLLSEAHLRPVPDRDYGADTLVLLSVGRLDPEKNPLLLADVLRDALERDPRWRLHVCGDGPMSSALRARVAELGVGHALKLHGYVPIDGGLWELYRTAHALLHVSMTEGVPQVILEAFAARLPVVATDVGSVEELVAGRGLLVGPGDAQAAASALTRLVSDPALRARLIDAGHRVAADHTLEAECSRLAGFLSTNS
jgi:glycosyltransferase involved in cell wall biosynthesis